MLRRLHTSSLRVGSVELDSDEAHHARDVLRLKAGEAVELFDDAGAVGRGVIERCDVTRVVARIEQVDSNQATSGITIAAAIPKGDRADWMIEKLSELGVERFIPLATARSVVLPAGKNKYQRWQRIATEAAKQSRRPGVMQIDQLKPLTTLLSVSPGTAGQSTHPPSPGSAGDSTRAPSPGTAGEGWGEGSSCYLSTASTSKPLLHHLSQLTNRKVQITLLIGPEGGWTSDEMKQMDDAGLTAVRLTATILRVETAAVAAAVIGALWKTH